MLDYQRVAEELRGAVCSQDMDDLDLLRATAAEYALACDEVNERLRQCGNQLRRGLRSEAIRLCEIEPNLLDAVAALDFPERGSWAEIATQFGIAPPPPLLLEIATELNAAYAVERPLAAMLEQHRLLALARGPLRARIETLRRLGEMDAENPVWAEDLRTFERARIKEIEREAGEAARRTDADALSGLAVELQRGLWAEPPPSDLVQSVIAAWEDARRAQALAELKKVQAQLNDAFSAMDVEAGRQLRARWNLLLPICGPSCTAELGALAAPALAWLDEEDLRERRQAEHAAAIAALERALDRREPEAVLERLYQAARREEGVPRELEDRYQTRIEDLHAAAARRTRRRIAVALLAVACAAATAVALLLYFSYRDAVASAAETLRQMIDGRELDQAEAYLNDLEANRPRVYAAPGVRELRDRIEGLLAEKSQRESKLADKLQGIAGLLDAVDATLADPGGDPIAAAERLKEGRASLLRVDERAKEAEKLARSQDERTRLATLTERAARSKDRIQREFDAACSKDLEDFESKLAILEAARSGNPETRRRSVANGLSRLSALRERHDQVSTELQERFDSAKTRLEALDGKAKAHSDRDISRRAVTLAVGDPAQFRTKLEEYLRCLPERQRGAGGADPAAEAETLETVAAWNTFVSEWRQTVRQPTAEMAASVAKTAESVLANCPAFPDTAAFRGRLPYLRAIAKRQERGQRIEKRLIDLFEDQLMRELRMVEDASGYRYYTRRDHPDIRPTPIAPTSYLVNFSQEKKIRVIRYEEVRYQGPAPQVTVAERAGAVLKNMSDAVWETRICAILDAILKDGSERPIDPVLRLRLLRETLTVGCTGSYCLEQALGSLATRLRESKVPEDANWLDPDNSARKFQQQDAEKELRDLPDFQQARQEVFEHRKDFEAPLGVEYRWVGWLCRETDEPERSWKCEGTLPKVPQELFVVCRGPDPSNPIAAEAFRLERIGRTDPNGNAVFDPTASRRLLEGRPVFIAVREN